MGVEGEKIGWKFSDFPGRKVRTVLFVFEQISVTYLTFPKLDKKLKFKLLLLLLSRFSHVRLCATPQTAAHQAPPSLGFSRQEHWSGLQFPSPKI